MRIAVLASTYPRFPGDGAAPFVRSLSVALAAAGHTVAVVAPHDIAVRPMPDDGVRVRRFRYIWPERLHIMGHARALENDARLRPMALALVPPFVAAAARTLWREADRIDAEVIHAHWVVPNGVAAALVAAARGVPLVVTLHGSDVFLALRNPAIGLVARWVFARAAAVTACSPDLRDGACRLGARSPVVIPWGADPAVFRPTDPPRREADRARFGWPADSFALAALGRLVEKKGFATLIAAMPALLHQAPQAHLVLGGDGDQRAELLALARAHGVRDRVTFAGVIPWDQTPQFLAAADCFVLPSQPDRRGNLDGLPTVLLEAMACGAPVVASRVAGAPLVVEHGVNGVLVPPAQPTALTDALASLANDGALRERLGAAARQTVIERHNWRAVAGQFDSILDSIAAARADSRTDATRSGDQRRLRLDATGSRPVPASAYDRDYYLASMHGAAQFAAAPGETLTNRLDYALDLAQLAPGHRVLDLGCGRGEVAWQCERRGAIAHALDFSSDAVQIVRSLDRRGVLAIEQASADHLPYADQTFDTVLMLDIIEHLYPEQLLAALREVRRVLKAKGRLVAHTMPNADYYRYGYPVYRFLLGLVGRRLPKDPRRRWYRGETHVNIQSPRSLRAVLVAAGFVAPRVWLQPVSDGPLKRAVAGAWPFRPVLCNDILAVAVRS